MTNGRVREAEEKDLDPILELIDQLSPRKREETRPVEEVFRAILADPYYHLAVYDEERKILGTAMLLVQRNLSHNNRPVGHIENVVTDRLARGRGVGRQLIEYLTGVAQRTDCYKVILNCTEPNVAFYEKCGFHSTGEVEMRRDI